MTLRVACIGLDGENVYERVPERNETLHLKAGLPAGSPLVANTIGMIARSIPSAIDIAFCRAHRKQMVVKVTHIACTISACSPHMAFVAPIMPIVLPWPLQSSLEDAAQALLDSDGGPRFVFSRPIGEAALLPPDSVSWRVFKNPLSLFIGGVAAVIMELAEPRVRTGVWEHTTFRVNPMRRLRRTGLAAMVTIYGARSTAETMIARVRQMHDMVAGTTSSGQAYRASDPELLTWVQGTAAYAFLQAYHVYVQPLAPSERNRYYAESMSAAHLYGATSAPRSEAELERLFHATARRLEHSDILLEFLAIMGSAPILPLPLRPAQQLLTRAAVDLTPHWARTILGLDGHGLSAWEGEVVRQVAAVMDGLVLESSPAVQACRRLHLPSEYLYVRHT